MAMRGLTRRVCSPVLAKATAARAAFERPPAPAGIGASLLTSAPTDAIISTSAPVVTTNAPSPSDAWKCMTSRAISPLASSWTGCAGSLYWPGVQERCAIGAPSIFRVSFVSFSSDSKRGRDSLRDAIRVNKRITASTSVQELLSVIATSHRDFNAVNVSTSWRMLAKVVHARTARGSERLTHGGSKDIATVVELLSRETTRVVNAMNPQDVANSLWAFGKLAERGMDVDAGAVRAVSGGAVRVAGNMIPQAVANSLWAFGKLAERGMDVDAGAVQAVSGGAVRVAGNMIPQHVGNSLWAFGKLAERGMDVDAGAVRAVSGGAVRVAGNMIPQAVANSLWAFGKLAERGMDVDAGAVQAVSGGAVRVAGDMNAHDVANLLWAFGKLAERGMDVDAGAVQAVSGGAVRVAGNMIPQAVANSLWAFGKLAERGVDVDAGAVRAVSGGAVGVAGKMNSIELSITLIGLRHLVVNGFPLSSLLDQSAWLALITRAKAIQHRMTHAQRDLSHRALSEIIQRSSEEGSHQMHESATRETNHPEVTPEGASAIFWAAGERWLSKLPEGKRAKLKNALSTAETDAAKVQLLVASAEEDTTKVRALDKRIILEAAAAVDLVAL